MEGKNRKRKERRKKEREKDERRVRTLRHCRYEKKELQQFEEKIREDYAVLSSSKSNKAQCRPERQNMRWESTQRKGRRGSRRIFNISFSLFLLILTLSSSFVCFLQVNWIVDNLPSASTFFLTDESGTEEVTLGFSFMHEQAERACMRVYERERREREREQIYVPFLKKKFLFHSLLQSDAINSRAVCLICFYFH